MRINSEKNICISKFKSLHHAHSFRIKRADMLLTSQDSSSRRNQNLRSARFEKYVPIER